MAERRPLAEELAQLYDGLFEKGAYTQHRAEYEMIKAGRTPHNYYRQRLLVRAESICNGRHLIEIGGGTGAFGVLAVARGWRYTGYDISKVAVAFCRDLSLDAYVYDTDSPPPLLPHSADAVVMWEVIEHVWDLTGYLDTVVGALRPGGVLLVSTPNYLRRAYQEKLDRGVGSSPPIHLNFFTRESLRAVLHCARFTEATVFERRIYRPALRPRSIVKYLKMALFLDQPQTLYGIALK